MVFWNKKFSFYKQRISNSKKFMSYCKNSFFIRQFFSFPEKILFKHTIVSNKIDADNPNYSSQMAISSFRDFTLSFIFTRFINSGVKSSIGYEFFSRGESFNVLDFCHEVECSCMPYSFDRGEDFNVLAFTCFCTGIFKEGFNSFEAFLEEEEFLNSSCEDEFFSWEVGSDGLLCKLFELGGRDFKFFAFGRGKEFFNFFKGSIFDSDGGWIFLKEFKDGIVVDISDGFKFRESDSEEFFNVIFSFSDFLSESFSFTSEFLEFLGEEGLRGELVVDVFDEKSDSFSVNGISFSFSEAEFSEIRDDEGIKDDADEVMEREVGEEIDVIAASGFTGDEDRFFGDTGEGFGEVFNSLRCKREGLREEDIFRGINDTGGEGVFRDIKTNEVGVGHGITSFLCGFCLGVRQGACFPILHLDEGLEAQPTYNGWSRQATHSFEGLKAQEKWSCPALLPFSCLPLNYNSTVLNLTLHSLTKFS